MNSVMADFISKTVKDPQLSNEIESVKMKYGKDNDAAMKSYLDYKAYGTSQPTERFIAPEDEQPLTEIDFSNPADPRNRQFNPINRIAGKVSSALFGGVERESQDLRSSFQRQRDGEATYTDTAATALSGAAQVAGETGFAALGGVASALTPDIIEKPIRKHFAESIESLATDEEGFFPQVFQSKVLPLFEKYERLKEEDPTSAQRIDSALGITELITAFTGAPLAQRSTMKALKKADDTIRAARPVAGQVKNAASKFDNVVNDGMNAVRPTVSGKKTASDIADYSQKSSTAVRSIIERKEALRLVNEFGEEIEGLPQNLRQFSHAIEQTRETVFKEYDDLAKQAGTAGAEVDLQRVSRELIDAVSDPKFVSLEDQAPEIADYLLKRATALERRGKYTTEQAQQAIKNYNQSLQAFYNNPTYESYAKASIDAMIANNLRKSLDDVIETATGAEYQALKNQYGALKAIEADVVKRSIVDARKNTKGLIDFTDILSGGDLVNGLLSANPALIGKAAVQKSIKEYFKFLNDPNRAIKSMFKRGEAIVNSTIPNN